MIFLIEYDRVKGRTENISVFDDTDGEAAADARLDRELELNTQRIDRELVLLEADSEAALRKTHRRYFENVGELARSASEAPDTFSATGTVKDL